ncbi:isoprenylcysteine carboxylmethyltransferase family protein [Candidatus Bathyarchaeota archaeon]|nr:isoprenylcysteine carboxylmethyltransferase family protein [Candidatus Bathyarchaeota archaeon]
MSYWFNVSLAGFVLILIPYWLSLEHDRLDRLLGESSHQIGDILGIISGWGFFGFWIGIWIAPQNRVQLGYPLLSLWGINFTAIDIGVGVLFFIPACYLGIKGVMDLGLKTAETHRPEKLVTNGLYGVIRHPQYVAGVLGHFGVSILLGSRDALLVTPIVLIVVYVICWKEEKELVKEYGREYRQYQKQVPMFIPRR